MNKPIYAIALSLICCSSAVEARQNCFRPYQAMVSNFSGGLADVKKTKGICGITRKTDIENRQSVHIIVKMRGAKLKVEAGPEGNKSTREIEFYSKNYKSTELPQVVLNLKGFASKGFYAKEQTFNVELKNESGGNAKLVDGCAVSGIGSTISQDKSIKISVKPDSYVIIESGPEHQKVSYKIRFVDQIGDHPTIILGQRGFFTSGISGRHLLIQSHRIGRKKIALRPKIDQPTTKAELRARKILTWKERKAKAKVKRENRNHFRRNTRRTK